MIYRSSHVNVNTGANNNNYNNNNKSRIYEISISSMCKALGVMKYRFSYIYINIGVNINNSNNNNLFQYPMVRNTENPWFSGMIAGKRNINLANFDNFPGFVGLHQFWRL